MSQATTRKKNFSISMKPTEIERIDEYVKELTKLTGFTVSRNELIRRAMLAHLNFKDKDGAKEYMEVFKGVGI